MNLNHFYHYYKSKSGGVSNLLLGSEELDQSDQGEWVRYNMNAVNANVPGVANPLSSDETVEQLDFEASTVARIAQTVTLTAGTEYTFSVWARAASGTKPFRLRYWDNVGGSGGGSAFTASATWSASTGRYEMTFTAQNSGTFQMFIQNAGGTAVSRRIYFWGAMLNVGASALDYVKTEFPAGPSNPPTAPMEFGDNFAGVTAYYSLRRFTKGEDNNAIRVRRSSDDTEQDIGFDSNGDLDSTALTTFVNEDVVKADTDFSTDTSGTSESGLDMLANQSIGERSGVLKATIQATTEEHRLIVNAVDTAANFHRIQTSVYIPSGQSGQTVDGFRIENGGYEVYATTTTKDAWVDIDVTWTSVPNANIFIKFLPSGGAENWTGNGTDEVYIGDVTITQTTADGAVTTFYDQSGNGNDATNSTDSEQPLVVSGGTLVTENGKAAVEFDGSDDELEDSSVSIDSTAYSAYMVANTTGNAQRALFRNRELGGFGTREGAAFFELQSNDTLNATFIDDGSGNAIGIQSGVAVADGQHLLSTEFTTSSAALFVDGTSTGAHDEIEAGSTPLASVSLPYINIGGARFSRPWSDKVQEIIIFDSDQSGNRGTVTTGGGTGIEGNINTYFDIV